jgi:hypothetical protein
MKRFKAFSTKKRIVAAGLAVGLTLGVAGAAFAYWTSSGQGTGSATTGHSTAFTVSSTADTSADLVPNTGILTATTPGKGVVDNVAYTVTNNSTGSVNLSQITIQVAGSTGTSPAATPTVFSVTSGGNPACTASDFSVGGALVGATFTDIVSLPKPVDLAAGATFDGSVSLQMVDNTFNQDSCQSITVPLFISAS